MNKALFIAALITIIMLPACKPPAYISPKTFGGEKYDSARAIIKIKDGYAMAGMTTTYGLGGVDVYWLKIDKNGRQVKQNTYGGKGDDKGLAIIETAEHGFFIAGSTTSYGAGNMDAYLVKTDSDGNYVSGKAFGGPGNDEVKAICRTDDGGYLMAGDSNSFGKNMFRSYLIKVDSGGNCVWARTYGGAGAEMANAVAPAGNDRYLAGGTSSPGNRKLPGMFAFMIDGSGNVAWKKHYDDAGSSAVNSVIRTSDNNFILAAERGSKGDASDVDLIKIDSSGGILWDRAFGGQMIDTPAQVVEAKDGGLVIAGTTESKGNGSSDIWLFKTDAAGMMKWEKTFGGKEDDYAAGVVQDDDGGFTVAGWTRSFGSGDYDVYFLKVNADGEFR
jgi:hypothetical protein